MIRNGGGLIDVTLCDGFLYCASVFSKSIAKATFSFPDVLDLAFGALYHGLPDVSYPWSFRTQTFRTQAETFRTHFRSVRTQPSGRFVPKNFLHKMFKKKRKVLFHLS